VTSKAREAFGDPASSGHKFCRDCWMLRSIAGNTTCAPRPHPGVVGAGGLGLEIVTAFHLFEYQEASALILVLLGLVSLINIFGARIRTVFLDGATE